MLDKKFYCKTWQRYVPIFKLNCDSFSSTDHLNEQKFWKLVESHQLLKEIVLGTNFKRYYHHSSNFGFSMYFQQSFPERVVIKEYAATN